MMRALCIFMSLWFIACAAKQPERYWTKDVSPEQSAQDQLECRKQAMYQTTGPGRVSGLEAIGRALQGFGAGGQGRTPSYVIEDRTPRMVLDENLYVLCLKAKGYRQVFPGTTALPSDPSSMKTVRAKPTTPPDEPTFLLQARQLKSDFITYGQDLQRLREQVDVIAPKMDLVIAHPNFAHVISVYRTWQARRAVVPTPENAQQAFLKELNQLKELRDALTEDERFLLVAVLDVEREWAALSKPAQQVDAQGLRLLRRQDALGSRATIETAQLLERGDVGMVSSIAQYMAIMDEIKSEFGIVAKLKSGLRKRVEEISERWRRPGDNDAD